MKNILYITALFCLVTFTSCREERETEAAKLEQMAKETNKLLPQKMDEITMVDSVSVKGMEFSYYYTILGRRKDSLGFDISQVKKILREQAASGIDTIPTFRDFKHQISFKYIYNDMNGNYLFDYTVRTKQKHK
ncbi:hypothetical protein ACLI09_15465 [Flavobacterium sp. RHBU_24]|uniref:hypothetical protein n=1 Tax=Flavobacterium sp. RHBU_24 TaxID=3391185 RepID=UPI0039853A43